MLSLLPLLLLLLERGASAGDREEWNIETDSPPRSRGSELRTILVRLISRWAGLEAGMEKAYHVTTGLHEAMAGTGVCEALLSWVFREH